MSVSHPHLGHYLFWSDQVMSVCGEKYICASTRTQGLKSKARKIPEVACGNKMKSSPSICELSLSRPGDVWCHCVFKGSVSRRSPTTNHSSHSSGLRLEGCDQFYSWPTDFLLVILTQWFSTFRWQPLWNQTTLSQRLPKTIGKNRYLHYNWQQ